MQTKTGTTVSWKLSVDVRSADKNLQRVRVKKVVDIFASIVYCIFIEKETAMYYIKEIQKQFNIDVETARQVFEGMNPAGGFSNMSSEEFAFWAKLSFQRIQRIV